MSSSVSVRPIIRFGVFFAVLVVERILVVPFAPTCSFWDLGWSLFKCEPAHTRSKQRHLGSPLGRLLGERTMGGTADPCDFCRLGHVTWRSKEMAIRQSSDKGVVQYRVSLLVGTCDNCGSRTLQPGSDWVFDAAFQREYDRLP